MYGIFGGDKGCQTPPNWAAEFHRFCELLQNNNSGSKSAVQWRERASKRNREAKKANGGQKGIEKRGKQNVTLKAYKAFGG